MNDKTADPVTLISQLVGDPSSADQVIWDDFTPEFTADVLEQLPAPTREVVWLSLTTDQRTAVLPQLDTPVQDSLIFHTTNDELASITPSLPLRTATLVVEQLDSKSAAAVIDALGLTESEAVQRNLASAPDSVLRWMRDDSVTIQADWALSEVVIHLKSNYSSLPWYTNTLLVVDENQHYLGKLPLIMLTTRSPETLVRDVLDNDTNVILSSANEAEVAALFDDHRLIQAAVVDEDQRLLGRVTIEEALTVIKKRSGDQFMKTAGMEHDTDLLATPLKSYKSRGVWLAINLVTVFMAAGVISLFQHTLQQIVALAVLMPIVSSMGGIAGSQTLTLTIRGLSMGQLSRGNLGWLFKKELWVGILHGVTWALVVGAVTAVWFGSPMLAVSIALALFLNLLAAAVVGVIIPVVLDKFGIDPALSGSVVLTTVTDIVGFTLFLGLATWWLL